MTTNEYMQGYAPAVAVQSGNPEAQKYGRLWAMPAYRAISPGEGLVPVFLAQANPRRVARCIDFGCGTGRAGLLLATLGGLNVTLVDFCRNCLDDEVRRAVETQSAPLAFVKADLENPLPIQPAEYGFCADVLEHIPPEKVYTVLNNILRAAKHVWFSIALYEDACGDLIGERLHLTLQPYEWWLSTLKAAGCIIHSSECIPVGNLQHHANFYVTLWQDGQVAVNAGSLNTSDAAILANMETNCAAGWQQVQPSILQDDAEVMILGGGPSLGKFEADIRQQRVDGVKLVTLNGTYNWCLERGLTPSATVIVDAREFNKRFVEPVVEGCKYLMASQVHPTVLQGLPKDRTFLWHVYGKQTELVVPKYYPTSWPIPGGSTVLLRTIPLLRQLGFRKFHLYGCDSCLADDVHHAYAQPENDSEVIVPVMVTGGRAFRCHPWMASQAQEFINLIKRMGDLFDLCIYGDGLLAHIVTTGAELVRDKEE